MDKDFLVGGFPDERGIKISKDTGSLFKVLKVMSDEAVRVELFRFSFLGIFCLL